jgi:dihydropteroate synthase
MNWQLRDRTLDLDQRCLVMGIVNVTPDSFSDGGRFLHRDAAVAHALELVAQGADLLDLGGESTRPGSQPVPLEEELNRVVPVVEALVKRTTVPLSIDTSKAAVAEACLQAGAHVINDVTGLAGDPGMVEVARRHGAGVVVMHMQGTPATMQVNPEYHDATTDIFSFLQLRIESIADQGLVRETIAIDPGIGFGKTFEHNLQLFNRLHEFRKLGRPLCLGVSRKGFLGQITGKPRSERLAGNLAAACFALSQDAVQILRVHDVAETRDAVLTWQRLKQG